MGDRKVYKRRNMIKKQMGENKMKEGMERNEASQKVRIRPGKKLSRKGGKEGRNEGR